MIGLEMNEVPCDFGGMLVHQYLSSGGLAPRILKATFSNFSVMSFRLRKYELPIPVEALRRIEHILREKRVFGFFDRTFDPYNLLSFVEQMLAHGSRSVAYFDQNVLNDCIEPVRMAFGDDMRPCTERGRFGAALMAFLQAGDILIEPSIAVHEKSEYGHRDLQLFRCADLVDPILYARLALGEIDRLPREALPALEEPEHHLDFSKPITNTSVFRIALLKIACLEVGSLERKEKMINLIRWSLEDFCFARVPILMGCSYLSPRRQSPMLKSLRSPDRRRALTGIENALWDMLLIQNWTKKVSAQKRENRLYLLCSRDAAVQTIANVICQADASPSDLEGYLRAFFVSFWGEKDGDELASFLFACERRRDDPARLHNKDRSPERLLQMRDALERELLEWRDEA